MYSATVKPFTRLFYPSGWAALRLACLLSTIIVAMSSCQHDRLAYTATQSIPQGEWHREEPLTFEVLVTDALVPYELYIYTRHENRYSYTTLPLLCTIKSRHGVLASDTLSLPLAQSPGRWNGQGIYLLQNSFKLRQPIYFPRSAFYTIELAPAARISPLRGVENIGVKLVPITQ